MRLFCALLSFKKIERKFAPFFLAALLTRQEFFPLFLFSFFEEGQKFVFDSFLALFYSFFYPLFLRVLTHSALYKFTCAFVYETKETRRERVRWCFFCPRRRVLFYHHQ